MQAKFTAITLLASRMLKAPLPRYRIYTQAADYLRFVSSFPARDEALLLQLEEAFCRTTGTTNAVAMPQDRVGIYMAVRALVRPGAKVILSPYTLSDVINMVICAGAVPVFADIDGSTCNIDPVEVERLIDDETDAVLVTHLHGLICDVERIGVICRQRGIALIEDAAQSLGAHMNGQAAGTFGDAGVFSFGMYKNVNSFYGGMLVTPRREVADKIRKQTAELPVQRMGALLSKVARGFATDLATHPFTFRTFTYWLFRYAYLHDIGFLNRQVRIELDPRLKTEMPTDYLCRMRPVQARLATAQLPTLEAHTAARIDAARLYEEGLSNIRDLIRAPWHDDGRHSYIHYPVQVPDREDLTRYMIREGRDVAVQHLTNCADLECFSMWYRDCPVARRVAGSLLLLPTYPRYTVAEIEQNVSTIRNYFGAS